MESRGTTPGNAWQGRNSARVEVASEDCVCVKMVKKDEGKVSNYGGRA